MKNILKITLVFSLLASACKKDDPLTPKLPPLPNDEELITTFTIYFTDPNGINPSTSATFRDLDGPGGNAPSSFDTIRLVSNSNYNASITLLDESKNPNVNISDEVLEEDEDHLFCFVPQAVLNLAITRTDTDGTYEVGLQSQWSTGLTSSGLTTISLKHQPGIKNGSCDLGDSDIELSFVTEIQ